ncbi:hypothetical protein CRE_24618 [Caenorhabditis remanei]|uniref:Uncharacterized protein n=1 Tax=Caenorhabditis remanei TaxID=31234 RepID=E3MVG7_CAERE|nr:hypothetical protein CRE_24618 [Caenorhabditis remanei]
MFHTLLSKDGLINNLHFIRYVCIAINILSMPMTYQSLLAWNSDKLQFFGIHPETKLHWKGVMRKMEDGKWEVDQTPRNHDLCVV